MEKNSHPLCACGTPVIVREHMVPCYDDGGSVDSFDVVVDFEDVCIDCHNRMLPIDPEPVQDLVPFHIAVMVLATEQSPKVEDDLPF